MAAAAMAPSGAARPPPPMERYQGVQKESAGYRLLATMGWKEGEGLGANKQGIKEHIRVKKKFENWGVGAVEAAEQARAWTTGMLDFHRVLSNLSEVTSQHANRSESSSEEEEGEQASDASDGEGARKRRKAGASQGAAAGGQGSRQQRQAAGKQAAGKKAGSTKRKAAEPSSSSGSDSKGEDQTGGSDQGGGRATPRGQPAAALPPAGPGAKKAATHIGRFKKRESAKMVKNYSEHDLAAILGGDPFAAAAAQLEALNTVQQQQRSSSSDSGSGSGSDQSGSGSDSEAAAERQQQRHDAAVAAVAAPPPKRQRRAAPAQPPTPEDAGEGQWWFGMFHRAGRLGSMRASVPGKGAGIKAHGFSEQDQTNLYNLAHDGATQGRVGLGRSSMPKKVAGARWQGKKTRLGSDSESEGEEQEAEEDLVPERQQQADEEGVVIVLPPSKRERHRQPEQPQGQQQEQQAGAGPVAGQGKNKELKAKERGGSKTKTKRSKQAAVDEERKPAQRAAKPAPEPASQPAAAAAAGSLAGIKWKKVVLAVLRASGKPRMKLSKLHRRLVKEQGLGKEQHGASLSLLTACVEGSSKLRIEDGIVHLAKV